MHDPFPFPLFVIFPQSFFSNKKMNIFFCCSKTGENMICSTQILFTFFFLNALPFPQACLLLFAFFSNEKCKMTGVIRFRPSSSSSSKGGIFFALLSFYFFPLLLRQVLEVEIFINSEFIKSGEKEVSENCRCYLIG